MSEINCPLCVNIQRLKDYLLAPDEVMFFDWLIIKQRYFKYKPFFYQAERILKETRIKRRSLERIVKRFSAMEILVASVCGKPNGVGATMYYYVDFTKIIDRLSEIIDADSDASKEFQNYFKHLAMQSAEEYGKNFFIINGRICL